MLPKFRMAGSKMTSSLSLFQLTALDDINIKASSLFNYPMGGVWPRPLWTRFLLSVNTDNLLLPFTNKRAVEGFACKSTRMHKASTIISMANLRLQLENEYCIAI